MSTQEERPAGRKQGAYNNGSLTGTIAALDKGAVILLMHDNKTVQGVKASLKRIAANEPKKRHDLSTWVASNADGSESFKLVRIERTK